MLKRRNKNITWSILHRYGRISKSVMRFCKIFCDWSFFLRIVLHNRSDTYTVVIRIHKLIDRNISELQAVAWNESSYIQVHSTWHRSVILNLCVLHWLINFFLFPHCIPKKASIISNSQQSFLSPVSCRIFIAELAFGTSHGFASAK